MLTERQITIVQDTFATIAPIADDVAVLFYLRLFELDPTLQAMFKTDMADQRRKLMQILTVAVKGLNHLDRLIPSVEDLGRRHTRYGVVDKHYETVGAALLWTLERMLGKAFTRETRDAWAAVYSVLSTTMKNAAARQAATAA